MRKVLCLFFLFASGFFDMFASSCKVVEPKDYFTEKNIDAIFVGKVVSMQTIPPSKGVSVSRIIYVVETYFVLKGDVPTIVKIFNISDMYGGYTLPNGTYLFSVGFEKAEKEWLGKAEDESKYQIERTTIIARPIECRCFSLMGVANQNFLDDLQREALLYERKVPVKK